jgi:hypothetical protein
LAAAGRMRDAFEAHDGLDARARATGAPRILRAWEVDL